MPVSQEVREFVKERADFCCQLFHRTDFRGEDGTPMDIVHRVHAGFGGAPDDSWKNEPKNLIFGCRRCHDLLHHPTKAYKIVEMDPDCTETVRDVMLNGEVVETEVPYPVLKIVDHTGHEIPQREIWLHTRLVKAQLGELLVSVRGDRMFESDRANAMLQLFDDFDLIAPDAASPEQMLAAEGFDSEVALKQIKAAAWIKQHELDWPRGLVVGKVNKFRSAAQKRLWSICSKEQVQIMLDAAVDMSKSDIAEEMKRLTIMMTQPRMYVLLWPSGECTLARVTNIELLKDRIAGRFSPMTDGMAIYKDATPNSNRIISPMIISVQKFISGFDVKRGKLNYSIRDHGGNEIPYLDDDDLLKEELPAALWLGNAPE